MSTSIESYNHITHAVLDWWHSAEIGDISVEVLRHHLSALLFIVDEFNDEDLEDDLSFLYGFAWRRF